MFKHDVNGIMKASNKVVDLNMVIPLFNKCSHEFRWESEFCLLKIAERNLIFADYYCRSMITLILLRRRENKL